jgi:alpha,alpha-trehalose phosphorylase
VTGPDEYSAVADNNVYTNLMAQRNLTAAADAAERHPRRATELRVDEEETASWRDAAAKMVIPYDEALGVHPQSERFTDHQRWDFEACKEEQYPLLLHFPYFDLYRKQVVKQADLVLALHVCGDAFTAEEKARDFEYYEALTVRDSSLSACCQAVVAAEVGHLDLAYDYFAEAALMDLDDLEHNTRDGIHIASVAGTWIAAVAGFGGMRDHGGELSFSPRLPAALTRLAFRLMFRGTSLRVEVDSGHARYSVVDGQPLEIHHHGSRETVEPGKTLELAIPHLHARPAPSQPPGRAPTKRRPPPR